MPIFPCKKYPGRQDATVFTTLSTRPVPYRIMRCAWNKANVETGITTSAHASSDTYPSCLPDGVVRAETDPVGNRPVLLHLLAQGHLGAEGLVGRLPNAMYASQSIRIASQQFRFEIGVKYFTISTSRSITFDVV